MPKWLKGWDPFEDIERLDDIFHRTLDIFRPSKFFREREEIKPAIDVYEEKDALIVKAELPGVDKKNIKVSVSGENLILEAEMKKETEIRKENFYHAERRYGKIYRSIPIPVAVETKKIKASYKDGILTVKLPKKPEARGEEIPIEIE